MGQAKARKLALGAAYGKSANPQYIPATMKFIDFLRRNPMVFDPRRSGGPFNYDTSRLLTGTTVFDCTEVAQQIVKSREEWVGQGSGFVLTEKGTELQKNHSWEVGIIPPFWNCFYEFPGSAFPQSGDAPKIEWFGVHCVAFSKETIEKDFAGLGFVHAIHMDVYMKSVGDPPILETVALYGMDAEGVVLRRVTQKTLAPGEDPALPFNKPITLPIIITLVSMMMLSHRFLKSTPVDPPSIPRQERQKHERNGTKPVPFERYHILAINPETTQPKNGTGVGGWHVAWHMVRAHLRHYKNGKVVPVRAHSRGNPTLGVVHKDYAVKAGT